MARVDDDDDGMGMPLSRGSGTREKYDEKQLQETRGRKTLRVVARCVIDARAKRRRRYGDASPSGVRVSLDGGTSRGGRRLLADQSSNNHPAEAAVIKIFIPVPSRRQRGVIDLSYYMCQRCGKG